MKKIRISQAIRYRICEIEDVDFRHRLRCGDLCSWVDFTDLLRAEGRRGNALAKVRRLSAQAERVLDRMFSGGRVEIE